MPFTVDDKKKLLTVKGVGPAVITRLEQLGFNNLEQLARADAREIVQGAASLVGSTCWRNSPQARTAIEAAIEAASGATSHR
jgi:predicted RecB family nuclease